MTFVMGAMGGGGLVQTIDGFNKTAQLAIGHLKRGLIDGEVRLMHSYSGRSVHAT